jgi:hypothetical protein
VSDITVVYIAGQGRIGSTLLDLLLGRLDGWFSLGEFRRFWHARRDDYRCGCGELVAECPVWSPVIARAGTRTVDDALADFKTTVRLRRLPGLASPRLAGSHRAAQERATRELGAVYRAAAEVTGARVLVDSSKDPLYGLLLGQAPDIEVHAIHLVRDSRAVAWSEQRTRARPELGDRVAHLPIRSPRATGVEWDLRNALARLAGARSCTYTRITYEALVADPDATVERIARAVVGSGAIAGPLQPTNHTVGGNPMRFETGALEIRPDVEWRTGMSAHDRRVVTALTWPLLRLYGYRGRGAG